MKKLQKISPTIFSVLGIFTQKDFKIYFNLGPIMLIEHNGDMALKLYFLNSSF